MKKNKKKLLVAAGVLLAVALGSGTFAWFTSQDDVKNHFEGELNGNDVKIVESFVPPKDVTPGTETNKDVAIANVSEYDALIRVNLSETLKKLVSTDEFYFDTTANKYYSWTKNGAEEEIVVYVLDKDFNKISEKNADGTPKTDGDGNVIYKTEKVKAKDYYTEKTAFLQADGTTEQATPVTPYEIPVKKSTDPNKDPLADGTSYKVVETSGIADYTATDGTVYEFVLFENHTQVATNEKSDEYSYIGQWIEKAKITKTAGKITGFKEEPKRIKAYLGSKAGTITRDVTIVDPNDRSQDVLNGITFSPGYEPKVAMVDKTYKEPATVANWVGTVATVAGDGEYALNEFVASGAVAPQLNLDADGNVTINSMLQDTITVDGTVTTIHPVEIKLNNQSITATPTPGKWFYNKADGYFYYIGNVAPGGQTPQLIDSVKLKGDADGTYSLMQYDLDVHAEGIQSNKEAVASWKPAITGTLKTALETAAKVQ